MIVVLSFILGIIAGMIMTGASIPILVSLGVVEDLAITLGTIIGGLTLSVSVIYAWINRKKF
ncbi:MAG TPA: hypothetical protein VLH94_03285 [Spirochaetia bacterium]|nr:hypothetical protein [Spirochaetia bacterium]